jgi:hypothetical protein
LKERKYGFSAIKWKMAYFCILLKS